MKRALLALVLLLATAHAAAAETFETVEYTAPGGWQEKPPARPRAGWRRLMGGPGKAEILIGVGQEASDAAALARAMLPRGAKITNEVPDVAVAGLPGHAAVARSGTKIIVVAATLGDGQSGGVVFLLYTTQKKYQQNFAAWAELVDGATIGGGGGGEEPPDDGGYQPDGKYDVTLVNGAANCTATMLWDGDTYQLSPGEARVIAAAAGNHTLQRQAFDGSWETASWNVPQYTRYTGACPPPAPPEPPEPVPPAVDPTPPADDGRGWTMSDDFAKDRLADGTRYAVHGPGLSVSGGRLRAQTAAHEHPILNIFPAFGRDASLSVDVRWVDGMSSIKIMTDWRYRSIGPHLGIYVLPDRNYVSFITKRGAGETAQPQFEKGRWYNVRVERAGGRVTVFIDGRETISTSLDQKGGDVHSVAAENDYGGFAIGLENEASPQLVEFDNLKVRGSASPVAFGAHVRDLAVAGKTVRFSVIYEHGFEAWASAQVEGAGGFLEYMAGVYGVPPMHDRLGMTQARGAYYDKGGGFNDYGWTVQAGSTTNPGGVNCHELGHNWYHLYGKRWLTEGSANLACYVWWNRDGGWTVDKIWPGDGIRGELQGGGEGWYVILDEDRYLTIDMNLFVQGVLQDSDRGYWMANVFTYVMYRVLGPEGYRQLHREAMALGHGMSSQEALEIMSRITGRDLGTLVAGWVFSGRGLAHVADSVRDSDGDGLYDLDERLFGLDPARVDSDGDGYADRGEMLAGFDPTSRAEPSGAVLIADGLPEDWKVKGVGDADEGLADADIKSVRVVGDRTNGLLWVRVDYQRPFGADEASRKETYVTVDVSLAGDGNVDYRANAGRAGWMGGFRTTGFLGNGKWAPDKWTGLDGAAMRSGWGTAGGGGFVELAIPWELVGGAATFSVYVNSGNGSKGVNDQLDAQPIKVTMGTSVPALPGKAWTPPAW